MYIVHVLARVFITCARLLFKNMHPGYPYQNRIDFIVFQIEMHNWAQKLMSRVPNTCITPESPKVFALKT